MKNSVVFCYTLLFALALHSSRSQSLTDSVTDSPRTSVIQGLQQTTAAADDKRIETAVAKTSEKRHGNLTAAASSSAEEHTDDPDPVDRRYIDSGTDNDNDNINEDDNDDGGRIAELYEDLEDSVVFEDSETDGGQRNETTASEGGDRKLVYEHGHPHSTADEEPSSPNTAAEEYDDAASAGSSPAVAVHIKYPEYVRSSSYRRGWPGGNVTRPEELFRFWDPYEWTATSAVSDQCTAHMEQYQAALRNGNMWAFKSE